MYIYIHIVLYMHITHIHVQALYIYRCCIYILFIQIYTWHNIVLGQIVFRTPYFLSRRSRTGLCRAVRRAARRCRPPGTRRSAASLSLSLSVSLSLSPPLSLSLSLSLSVSLSFSLSLSLPPSYCVLSLSEAHRLAYIYIYIPNLVESTGYRGTAERGSSP